MLAAVLFDLDGVLIDSREAWFRLLNDATAHFGHPGIERAGFDARFGQGVQADAADFFGGMDPATLSAWFDAHFLDHAARVSVEPDAAAVLRALAQRRVATAIVTNSTSALAREIARGAGLEVDALVGGSDVARPKPAPDALLLACERLGAPPGQAWMVGDSRYDRDAAHAAGVPFVGYRCDGQRRIERLGELLSLAEQRA